MRIPQESHADRSQGSREFDRLRRREHVPDLRQGRVCQTQQWKGISRTRTTRHPAPSRASVLAPSTTPLFRGHPLRRASQDRPGPPRAQVRRGDPQHVRAPLAGLRRRTREAIDAAFGMQRQTKDLEPATAANLAELQDEPALPPANPAPDKLTEILSELDALDLADCTRTSDDLRA